MKKALHIYAFGSICRGEIGPGSDIDLLAISSGDSNQLSRSQFSIYSHSKIQKIWLDGNPFAWHLHLESKLIYSSDSRDFISALGKPAIYRGQEKDCQRFFEVFEEALASINKDRSSVVFDLSAAFLALRNFATCYLLGGGNYDFSRGVALRLMDDFSASEISAYSLLERARLLCTRGYGPMLTNAEIDDAVSKLPKFKERMREFINVKAGDPS